jgi:hypothetical protein
MPLIVNYEVFLGIDDQGVIVESNNDIRDDGASTALIESDVLVLSHKLMPAEGLFFEETPFFRPSTVRGKCLCGWTASRANKKSLEIAYQNHLQ